MSRCFKEELISHPCRGMGNSAEKNLNMKHSSFFLQRGRIIISGLETMLVIFCQEIWLLWAYPKNLPEAELRRFGLRELAKKILR